MNERSDNNDSLMSSRPMLGRKPSVPHSEDCEPVWIDAPASRNPNGKRLAGWNCAPECPNRLDSIAKHRESQLKHRASATRISSAERRAAVAKAQGHLIGIGTYHEAAWGDIPVIGCECLKGWHPDIRQKTYQFPNGDVHKWWCDPLCTCAECKDRLHRELFGRKDRAKPGSALYDRFLLAERAIRECVTDPELREFVVSFWTDPDVLLGMPTSFELDSVSVELLAKLQEA